MERKDIIGMLEMLRMAYPNNYSKMSSAEMSKQIEFYLNFFQEEPADLMRIAVEHYIETSRFPPTVAGLKDAVARLKAGPDVDTLWKEAWSAICGNKKFDELSAANQKYFGNQSMIDNLGQDENTIQSVIKGQYTRRIGEILETEDITTKAKIS